MARPASNMNEVHKNIVHSENIKKEMKFYDKNRMDHFQLNPNNSKESFIDVAVVILADKPNHVKPQSQQQKRGTSAP